MFAGPNVSIAIAKIQTTGCDYLHFVDKSMIEVAFNLGRLLAHPNTLSVIYLSFLQLGLSRESNLVVCVSQRFVGLMRKSLRFQEFFH